MSIDYNKSIVGGRLTASPTPIGDNGCRFSVATNRTYKNRDGDHQEETTYVDCVAWGRLSELVLDRCDTGSAVLVEGRIEVRRVEDDEGNTRRYTNVVANDVRFVSGLRKKDDTAPHESGLNVQGMKLPPGTSQATVDALNVLLASK